MFCPSAKRSTVSASLAARIVTLISWSISRPKSQTAEEDSRRFEADRFEPEAKLVVIRTYQNAIEADLARSALDAAGIPSILSDSVARQYISLALPLKLLVRAEDAEDAEKILDMDASDGENTE
jgi:hypothetical protein